MRTILALTLIFRLTVGETTEEPYRVTPLNNSGVLFEDLGTLMVYHNTWNILTELDLSELENQTRLAEHAEHLVHRLCVNSTDTKDLCNIQQTHVHAIIDNIKRRTSTIQELVPKSRTTRSIFDGIGNAMHYLFGTMDSGNEREIYSQLDELESNTQALAELEKQQISVVKTTLGQIQKPLVTLMDRQRQIAYQLNDLSNVTEELARRQLRQEILSSLVLQVIEIEFRQQSLLEIIIASKNNHIHPLLVSPNTLLETYHKTNTECPNQQSCLSLLYQTAGAQSHLLREKLIIRITLPIFDIPSMKLQQIRCFPIHTKASHSLIPDIEYSHVASQLQTQEFLLLKPENVKAFQRITHNREENTFVGRLNTPIIRAMSSKECVIKLLLNPLNESPHCALRIQNPKRDILIKLNKPNAWLFSFTAPLVAHVSCPNRFTISKLNEQGIISLTKPCQIQVGTQVLHYEGENKHPLRIMQPPYFPSQNDTKFNIDFIENLADTRKENMIKPELLTGDTTNELIHKSTQSLEEIQAKVTKLQEQKSHRTSHIMATTAISTTSLLVLAIVIYVATKYIYPSITKRLYKINTPPPNNEIPLSEPTYARPQPLKRSKSLPKPKSVQLV